MGTENHIESLGQLNTAERERAHTISDNEFDARVGIEGNTPTDDERRLGAFIDMIEPQVREALITLIQKGYITIDSGYHGMKYEEGVQYIGFEKDMIDVAIVPKINEVLKDNQITATLEEGEFADYLELTPTGFLSIEEWKEVWNKVATIFPKRDTPAPFRERFLYKRRH